MRIGIDGSRAFIKQRTGIEEYSYQVIKNLRSELSEQRVFLYTRKNQIVDFDLPENWKVKIIKFPRFWTQLGLSLEMLLHPVDALFVPAHTVPWIHPKKTIVTVHGLEYEVMPQAYSWWERFYMCLSIKNSCHWASTVISVSNNTKKDLMARYGIGMDKIIIVHEGYDIAEKSRISGSNFDKYKPYLLFVGRLEERKNIMGIIKTFEILKEKYKVSHKLVLAGRGGYGFAKITAMIEKSKYNTDIMQLGFFKDEDKADLITNADVFLFPTFYEGFGIPVLEAQSVGVPVVTSDISSLPEVAGEGAILVNPNNPMHIAERTYKIISDKSLRDDIIKKGYENVKRFSWEKCAQEIARIIAN